LKSPGNEENFQAFKNRKKEADKRYREKVKTNIEKAEQLKIQKRDFMRRQRAKNRAVSQETLHSSPEETENESFKNKSAASRALRKAETALSDSLPKNEKQKKEILSKLFKRQLSPNLQKEHDEPPEKRKNPRRGFEEVKKAVIAFYQSDLASRINPGKDDCVKIIQEDGSTDGYTQSLTMTMSIENAHKVFLDTFPDYQIAVTTFGRLRPPHVKLYSHIKHESCLCSYCENMQLLVEGLNKYMTEKHNSWSLISLFTCDEKNINCMMNNCDACSDFMPKFNALMRSCCQDEQMTFFEWGKEGPFYQRKSVQMKVSEGILRFENDFKKFRKHKFIARLQKETLKKKIEDLKSNEAVIIMDFAEKFISKARREIQSCFFGKRLITVFTCKIYMKDQEIPYVIASDEQSQNKEVVFAFMKKIIEFLKSKNPNVKKLIIFTDGSGGQFKNRFNFLNLLHAKDDFGVDIEWHFFATSHGKSVCDGIGGTIKRGVHRKAIASDAHVYTAKEFVSSALGFIKKLEVTEVTKEEILKHKQMLTARWAQAKTIPGTQSFHYFWVSNKPGYINASKTSNAQTFSEFKMI
jgi:hypothetical protein